MNHPFELVSIHIPKSAGTSFRLILQSVYGDDGVRRLDINSKLGGLQIDQEKKEVSDLPKSLKVAHGHFSYRDFESVFGTPDVPVITWLRHPVERVVSQYYFLIQRFHDQVIHTNNSKGVFNRLCRDLIEFAELPGNRNLQSKYLRDVDINQLSFVGIVEHFDEDLKALAEQLRWGQVIGIHDNKTRNQIKKEIEQDLFNKILNLNLEDFELYSKALEMRNQRVS